MKSTTVRRMWQNLFALGLSTLAPGVCLSQTDTPALPQIAAYASPARYLPGTYYDGPITRVLWTSPTQFITLPTGQRLDPGSSTLFVTDMATGAQTPLDVINASILKAADVTKDGKVAVNADGKPKGVFFNPSATQLSPDGRWLLWPSGSQRQPTWLAMTLDGTERREWPRHTGGAGWMRDGIHFVEVVEGVSQGIWIRSAYVYSLETSTVQDFPLEAPQRCMFFCFPTCAVLFTTDGHGWLMNRFGERWEIVPGPQVWVMHNAPLLTTSPAGDKLAVDSALSPSGDWLVRRDNSDCKAARTRISISRPDGSEEQTILDTGSPLSSGSRYAFDPEWTPDERGIIFHWSGYGRLGDPGYKEGLYMISLDQSEVCLPRHASRLASRGTKKGLFPTTVRGTREALLAKNASH